MPLTDEERVQLRDIAERNGVSADDLIGEAEKVADAADPAPGKNDAAAGAEPAAAGAESGAKAHGGRGYFAYEYPFLTVNEVRKSLFLEPVDDGDLFTGEWLSRHSAPTPGPATPAE